LAGLADAGAFAAWLAPFRKSEWVVYAKPPFGGPEAVLAYLSRYTHRVAISNSRLVSADAATVAFRWKDYRIKQGDRQKVMRLATGEFIRRFLIHVLPDGFHRIRHYGLLASATRKANIAKIRALLGADRPNQEPPASAETKSARSSRSPCASHAPLRRPDAHRRDLPPRSTTAIARATKRAGRMTIRPSPHRSASGPQPGAGRLPILPKCAPSRNAPQPAPRRPEPPGDQGQRPLPHGITDHAPQPRDRQPSRHRSALFPHRHTQPPAASSLGGFPTRAEVAPGPKPHAAARIGKPSPK
jgi:hypothetical protein